MARARDGGLHDVVDEMFPLMVHPSRAHEAGLRELFHDMADDVGIEGFTNNQTAIIARADSRPTLATIKCPTLVLTGDQDLVIPNGLSTEMAQGIAGAKLVILPNCGHCPQPEQPEATAEALAEWLGLSVVSAARTA